MTIYKFLSIFPLESLLEDGGGDMSMDILVLVIVPLNVIQANHMLSMKRLGLTCWKVDQQGQMFELSVCGKHLKEAEIGESADILTYLTFYFQPSINC